MLLFGWGQRKVVDWSQTEKERWASISTATARPTHVIIPKTSILNAHQTTAYTNIQYVSISPTAKSIPSPQQAFTFRQEPREPIFDDPSVIIRYLQCSSSVRK